MKPAIILGWMAVFVLGMMALAGISHQGFRVGGGERLLGESVEFRIPDGAGFSQAVEILTGGGVLDRPRLFRLVARLEGADRQIRAGWYQVPLGTSPGKLLDRLREGPNVLEKVTIPEGLWLTETLDILARELGVDRAELDSIAGDAELLLNWKVPGPTLEGYLFPDTYLLQRGIAPEAILHTMIQAFHREFGEAERVRAAEIGMTVREVITLASIIEAEAVVADERSRISAVFHNRLRLGWRLQADPTVQYARGNRKRLFTRHLAIDSPYNTYVVSGLPPGPICSPGAASIHSALYPAENSDELYFVAARESGRHIFSKSGREHERARRQVKQRAERP